MIRVEKLPEDGKTEIFRLFHDDNAPLMSKYDGLMGVLWLPGEMWIKGFLVRNGRVGRKWLLELLDEADRGNAQWIKTSRAVGHVLPFGEAQPNGDVWVNVAEVRGRFPVDTDFRPL